MVVVFLVLLSDHFADCAHLCHALGDLAQGLLGAGMLPVTRVDTPRCRRMDGGERDAGVALAPAADAPSGLTATRTVLQGTPTSSQGGGSLSLGGGPASFSGPLVFSCRETRGNSHTKQGTNQQPKGPFTHSPRRTTTTSPRLRNVFIAPKGGSAPVGGPSRPPSLRT